MPADVSEGAQLPGLGTDDEHGLRPGPRREVAPRLGELRYVPGELPRALEDLLVLSVQNLGVAIAARGKGCARS